MVPALVRVQLTTFSLSLLVSYRPLVKYGEVVCMQRTRAGRIDENSLRAFTLSIVAKGTPLCLGAGRRAVPTLDFKSQL